MPRKLILLFAIGVALLASGNLVSAHGAWQEIRRQGWRTDFREITFIDSQNGWAVGSRGIIIHTADGGNTWEEQYNAFNHSLEGIHFADINNGWAVGSPGVILHTTDGGKTWIPQISGVVSNLSSVYFVDPNSGSAAAADAILHTFDGGRSWNRQFLEQRPDFSINLIHLTDTHFVSEKAGWIVGAAERWISQPDRHETGGVILKTDGFISKVQIFEPTVSQFEGVYFVDDSTGWVVGRNLAFSTTDGGQTWASQAVDTSTFLKLTSVHFIDKNFGWAVGTDDLGVGDGAVVFRTQDGGETWVRQEVSDLPILYDVHFVDASNGWTVGAPGTILHTSDGGASWKAQVNPLYDFTAVHLVSDSEGWATAGGVGVLHTTDGGVTWETQITNQKWFNDLFFVNSSHGWAVGGVDTILHTNDAGKTWVFQKGGGEVGARKSNLSIQMWAGC